MLSDIRRPIEKEMAEFNLLMDEKLRSDNGFISSIVNYAFRKKGKQMRPLLVMLTAALNGEITKKTYIAAILVEMTHTASLIHDDILDEAFMRRGQFSANALWRSKVAVLAGDYILSRALTIASEDGASDLLGIITGSFENLSEGELLQMDHTFRLDMTEEAYFETIKKKTASLLGSCGALGARSIDCGRDVEDNMRAFGKNIGMAFQIKDDILDFEPGKHTGKPALNDIKERKITLPLLRLLETSSAASRKKIVRLLSSIRDNEENAGKIHAMLAGSDAISYSEKHMEHFRDRALSALSVYPESEIKRSLTKYCEYILTRER